MATVKLEAGRMKESMDHFRTTPAAEKLSIGIQTVIDAKDWIVALPKYYKALGALAMVLLPTAVNSMLSTPNYAEQLRDEFVAGLRDPKKTERFSDGVYKVDRVTSLPISRPLPEDIKHFGYSVEMPLILKNPRTGTEYYAFGEDYNRDGTIGKDEVNFVLRSEAHLEQGTGTGATVRLPVSSQKPQFGTVALDGSQGRIFEAGIIDDSHVDPNE